MKASYSSLFASVLLGTAVAAPSELERRVVVNNPITLEYGPTATQTLPCGLGNYAGDQVHLSIQYGVNLARAGETRGKAKYPHSIQNDDSKGVKLTFPPWCPPDTNRMEYPMKVPTFNGGPNNVNTGQERVVYYWTGGLGPDGNPDVKYCGIITHEGAATGGFLDCPAAAPVAPPIVPPIEPTPPVNPNPPVEPPVDPTLPVNPNPPVEPNPPTRPTLPLPGRPGGEPKPPFEVSRS